MDYWDKVFGNDDVVAYHVSPDDLSSVVSNLSEADRPNAGCTHHDQADQDGIIRANSRGALIMDAGLEPARPPWPCTGRRTCRIRSIARGYAADTCPFLARTALT